MSVTQRLSIDAVQPEAAVIKRAAAILQQGGLVAFPTETVYGLGADALNERAVARIFQAKDRPTYDPLIVHIATRSMLERIVQQVSAQALQLADQFWPGPLTLVLPKTALVPDLVTAGGASVAVRWPQHPVAQALILAAERPIAAPSANRFSHTSPTSAQHVWDDLAGRIELILDGGATPIGVESTVLDLCGEVPLLLRPGGITKEALTQAVGEIALHPRLTTRLGTGVHPNATATPLPSPGMLDRHYAPKAELYLFTGEITAVLAQMTQHAQAAIDTGKRVGLLLADDDQVTLARPPTLILRIGKRQELAAIAQHLFAALRQFDAAGIDLILAHEFPSHGLGLAINDRLRRAAKVVMSDE